jgi:phosphoenolpyruvate---glycerone phosphotransferase subunit DhaM
MRKSVAIVIVSHSADVAKGLADMVHQMVGADVRVAWTGGDPGGGLGTDVVKIQRALESVWSEAGVAVFVDLGGAETNSEMAVERLPPERRGRVTICNAPLVEGAIVAAAEAASGADLEHVRKAAEEFLR